MRHIIRARAFILHQGQVLVMKRVKNGETYYTLPGGKSEENETPEQTCLREVFEETTVQIKVDREIGRAQDEFMGMPNTHIIFACDYLSGTPVLSGEEVLRHAPDNSYEPLWVDAAQITQLLFRPALINDLLKRTVK